MSSSGVSHIYSLVKEDLIAYLEDNFVFKAEPQHTVAELRKIAVAFIRQSVESPPGGSGAKQVDPVSSVLSITDVTIIKESLIPVPCLSTCEPHLVLSFLIAADTAVNQNPGGDAVLLKLLGCKVSGRVSHLLREELKRVPSSFSRFKSAVLELVFPPDVRRRFVQIYVDRLQRPDESLHAYVDSVIAYENALNLCMSESELTSLIVSNFMPCYKDMCPIGSNPSSLSALYVLLGSMENRVFERQHYYSIYSPPAVPVQGRVACAQRAAGRSAPSQGRLQDAPQVSSRCANCSQRGHNARACPLPVVAYNDRRCFRCRAVGHISSSCPSGNAPRL